MESISLKIKEFLRENNMSQKKLAELTGLTEATISYYVNGTRIPRGENLIKIAKILNTTTDSLLYNQKENEEEYEEIMRIITRGTKKMSQEKNII